MLIRQTDEAEPALGTAVEEPVAETLDAGLSESTDWVSIGASNARRRAANFVRLEIRLFGEVLDSFSEFLTILGVA